MNLNKSPLKPMGLLLVIVSSTLLFACKNIPPVTSGIGSDKISSTESFSKHLKVDNPDLGKQLAITDIKSRQNNGLLEVNLDLTSSYKKSLNLQYQFQWFDKDGFIVEAEKSPWKALYLHGFGTATTKALAPNDKVSSFRIYVRKVAEKAFKF